MYQFNRLLLYIQSGRGKNMGGAFGLQLIETLQEHHVYGSAQFILPYPMPKKLSDIINTAVTQFGYNVNVQFMLPDDTLMFSQGYYRITSKDSINV